MFYNTIGENQTMTKGIPTDPELKAKILRTIHEEGITAYKASEIFGVQKRTISHWLEKEANGKTSSRNYIAEINQLKKRLDNAHRVIGELVAEVKRPKE